MVKKYYTGVIKLTKPQEKIKPYYTGHIKLVQTKKKKQSLCL